MLNVLSVTLKTDKAVIVHKSKEIKTNSLHNLIVELKSLQADVNDLLTNMVNNGGGETEGKEIGVDDEDEDSESESITIAVGENGMSQKRTQDINRSSKKRKM